MITLVVAYIAAAVVLVPSGKVPEFNFVDERGAVTVLSAILLAMGEWICVCFVFNLTGRR